MSPRRRRRRRRRRREDSEQSCGEVVKDNAKKNKENSTSITKIQSFILEPKIH